MAEEAYGELIKSCGFYTGGKRKEEWRGCLNSKKDIKMKTVFVAKMLRLIF